MFDLAGNTILHLGFLYNIGYVNTNMMSTVKTNIDAHPGLSIALSLTQDTVFHNLYGWPEYSVGLLNVSEPLLGICVYINNEKIKGRISYRNMCRSPIFRMAEHQSRHVPSKTMRWNAQARTSLSAAYLTWHGRNPWHDAICSCR
jgi:hypothetical protein